MLYSVKNVISLPYFLYVIIVLIYVDWYQFHILIDTSKRHNQTPRNFRTCAIINIIILALESRARISRQNLALESRARISRQNLALESRARSKTYINDRIRSRNNTRTNKTNNNEEQKYNSIAEFYLFAQSKTLSLTFIQSH